MKQKHAEVIKAWADGAEIEYYCHTALDWRAKEHKAWVDNYEYRVRPKAKVVRWQWIWRNQSGHTYIPSDLLTEKEIKNHRNKEFCLGKAEWTRMEFDE